MEVGTLSRIGYGHIWCFCGCSKVCRELGRGGAFLTLLWFSSSQVPRSHYQRNDSVGLPMSTRNGSSATISREVSCWYLLCEFVHLHGHKVQELATSTSSRLAGFLKSITESCKQNCHTVSA